MTWSAIIKPVSFFLLLFSLIFWSTAGHAADPIYKKIGLDAQVGKTVSLDATVRLASGKQTTLRALTQSGQPLILVLAYYHCPMLCSLVLDGVEKSVAPLWPAQKFTLLTISIDPHEPLKNAKNYQDRYAAKYPNWQFGVASANVIRTLENQIGFRAVYFPKTGEYAHPAVITFLAPDGRISRYLLGVEYRPQDVRLALAEARNFQFNSAIDKVVLFCYNYDPVTNRYVIQAFNVMKVGAAMTVIGIIAWVIYLILQERRKSRSITHE
ncbi:MAG: SCO family protein [Candidatus Margulisiibacteriota bacterium]